MNYSSIKQNCRLAISLIDIVSRQWRSTNPSRRFAVRNLEDADGSMSELRRAGGHIQPPPSHAETAGEAPKYPFYNTPNPERIKVGMLLFRNICNHTMSLLRAIGTR
jgi:hypothetical protein